MCASFLVWLHACEGRDDLAAACAADAMARCDLLAQPSTRGFVETVLSTWYDFVGDHASAEPHARVVIHLAAEQGMPHWDAQAQITLGWSFVGRPEKGDGAATMRSAIGALTGIGTFASMSFYYAGLAEAELAAGRWKASGDALAAGLAYVERSDERIFEAGLYTLAGRLAFAESDRDRARGSFEHALSVGRAQGAEGLVRRTLAAMHAVGITEGD